jgi:hypothetical protein
VWSVPKTYISQGGGYLGMRAKGEEHGGWRKVRLDSSLVLLDGAL